MKLIVNYKMTALLIMLLCGFSFCSDVEKETNGNTLPEPKPTVKGDVTMYITTNTRSQDFKKQATDFSTRDNMSPTTLKLEPATRYQTMDGFGAAVTGSTAFNLMQMTPENRTRFLKETFSDTEGMGQSYIRVSIGCSDFSLSEYSLCDTPGIENFALTSEETIYVIPVLKEILAINPNVKIMGSPWTPPRWMKVNNLTDLQPFNSWTSGQLNRRITTIAGVFREVDSGIKAHTALRYTRDAAKRTPEPGQLGIALHDLARATRLREERVDLK